jgi:hypothetical protein
VNVHFDLLDFLRGGEFVPALPGQANTLSDRKGNTDHNCGETADIAAQQLKPF